ncbi:hypothetical protein [uncultured Pontibacter sp.]|uniref:hypothetical protein n=1 Tax=uncultured Pontibacter sp. TaxID=453356 RepID=UPI00261CB3B9|nr:hypothetical protein [uncultured Pontibacter sp.]
MTDQVLTGLYQSQAFEELITYYNEQLARDKSNFIYYGAKGKALLELNQYQEAILELSVALQLNPKYSIGFYNRALCYFELEKNELAILDFEAAQTLDSTVESYMLIGLAHFYLYQDKEAISNFSLYLKNQQDNQVLKWRAEAYYNLGQNRLALKDYELVLLSELNEPGNLKQLEEINYAGLFSFKDETTTTLKIEQHNFILCPHSIYSAFYLNTSGVYILQFVNNEYYVGQTVKLLNRLRAHQKVYIDILHVYFRPVAAADLLAEETATISLLESNQFRIRNLKQIEFNSLFNSNQQKEWLNDLEFNFIAGNKFDNNTVRKKYEANFISFKSKPCYNDFILLVSEYIKRSIPNYLASEYNYWSISCLPKYLAKENCISRININSIPVLSVYLNFDNSLTMMLCISKLPFMVYLNEYGGFESVFDSIPSLKLGIRDTFENAEGDELILFIDQADFLNALNNEIILRAIRMINLRMMNKTGKEIKYRRTVSHCLDLSDILVQNIKS